MGTVGINAVRELLNVVQPLKLDAL